MNATCCRSKAHAEYYGTSGVVSKVTTMPGSGSCATIIKIRDCFILFSLHSPSCIIKTTRDVHFFLSHVKNRPILSQFTTLISYHIRPFSMKSILLYQNHQVKSFSAAVVMQYAEGRPGSLRYNWCARKLILVDDARLTMHREHCDILLVCS